MLNLNKQLNQKNFKKKPNKLMKAMLPALCIGTFSFTAQAAVENLVFEDDLKDIKISWDEVVNDSHVGYNLYRSDTVDGERTLINDESLVLGEATRFSNAVPGQTYYFHVESVDAEAVEASEGIEAVVPNVLDTSAPTAYALADTDGDGMSDDWENTYDLDASSDDSAVDLDKDGLTNLEEYQYQSDTEQDDIKPNYADSDGDGIHDGFEVAHEGLDPGFADSGEDADEDGFSNLAEFEAGSNPALYNETPDSIGGDSSTTETFIVLEDSYIDANKSKNDGADVKIKLTVDRRTGYLKFDTSAIPDGSTITNASLNLTAFSAFDLSVHSTTNDWVETTEAYEAWPAAGDIVSTQDVAAEVVTGFDVTSITTDGILSFAITTTQGGTKSIYTKENGDKFATLDVSYSSGSVDLPPAKVENLTAVEGVAAVNLTWDAGVDSDGTIASYNIYRRANQNFLFGNPIANVTSGTAYTDATANADHHYQYIITAVDNGGNESKVSAVLDIENVTGNGVTTDPKPTTVDNVTADDNVSGIKVFWESVSDSDLAGYNVYRDNVLLNPDALIKNTLKNYTDYTAEVNTEYQYRVEAVDDAGQVSDASESAPYTLLDTDLDGLSDHFEEKYSGDIYEDGVIWDSTTPEGDADGDGLSNLGEYNAITDPTIADTDEDGMPDGFEVDNLLDPTNDKDSDWTGSNKDDAALIDPDGDGDSNLDEYLANSDVNDAKFNVMNPNGVDQFYATMTPSADTYVTDQYPDQTSYQQTFEVADPVERIFNTEPSLLLWDKHTYVDLTEEELLSATAEEILAATKEESHNLTAYIKFDVNTIDMEEGDPLKATLRLHRTGTGNITDLAIYKVTNNDWDSATLTYSSANGLKGAVIASDLTIAGNKIVGATNSSFLTEEEWLDVDPETTKHQYLDIDVSDAITKGEKVSFAIARTNTESGNDKGIDSLESELFAPSLSIIYTKESMDLDFDGLPDFWERRYGLDPESNDSGLDLDGDGLTNLEEYELGLNPILTDSDGDGVDDNVEIANGTSPSVPDDFVAPYFAEEIDAVVVDATGLLTDITEDLLTANITAFDDFDGQDIVAIIVEGAEVLLTSGRHTVTLQATDVAGFVATTDIEVHINPEANFGLDTIAEPGAQLSLPVTLSGDAANYPVTIDYQVTFNEEITLGQFTIEEGNTADLVLAISNDLQTGDTLLVNFTGATNAVVDTTAELTVNISSENFVPTVAVSVSQADILVSSISPSSGLVTLTADISDINVNNVHSITFESIDGVLTDDGSDELSNTFTFDPAGLDTGDYEVKVTIAETNTTELFAIEVLTTLHVDATLMEVVADSDQNGIPDAEDIYNNVALLPIADGELPLTVATGLKLSLGDYAQGNGNASISKELLETDMEFDAVSTITNFKIEGLNIVGDSVQLVLPLPSGVKAVEAVEAVAAVEASDGVEAVEAIEAVEAVEGIDGVTIPDNAVYRKYTEAKGWFDFVEDENNSIGSALKDADGLCPAPASDNYLAADLITASGLLAGKECIQLTIEDGGPNDADGVANGIVVDPGVLVVDHVNLAPVVSIGNVSAMSNTDVALTASSTDYEGDTISYSWVQVAGPSVSIEGTSSNTITFVAPNVLEDTTLIFEVVASDGAATSSEVATVSVSSDPSYTKKDSGGSFGWLLSLVALAGLARRKVFK